MAEGGKGRVDLMLTAGAVPESVISTSAACSVGACWGGCARPFVSAGSMSGFWTGAGLGDGSAILEGRW